jgi:hypothetical protein
VADRDAEAAMAAAPDNSGPGRPKTDPAHRDVKDDGRDETPNERADRNFAELLQELRVAQTGVQLLFAFLLTLPFTQRFTAINDRQRYTYIVSLFFTAVATACLLAPVSHHRTVFARSLKPHLVVTSSRLAHVGMGCLFLAMMGGLYLILDVVAGTGTAIVLCACAATVFVITWYVHPIYDRYRR